MGQPLYDTSDSRTSAGLSSALRSLKRYKRTPEYRAQLALAATKAVLEEVQATTTGAQLRARLTAFECRTERDSLERGESPDPFSGWCKFRIPAED